MRWQICFPRGRNTRGIEVFRFDAVAAVSSVWSSRDGHG